MRVKLALGGAEEDSRCRRSGNTSAVVAWTTEFDKASNKLYERALHAESRSHLYEPVVDAEPQGGYDSLNRLRQYQRGTLASGGESVSSVIALPNTDEFRTYPRSPEEAQAYARLADKALVIAQHPAVKKAELANRPEKLSGLGSALTAGYPVSGISRKAPWSGHEQATRWLTVEGKEISFLTGYMTMMPTEFENPLQCASSCK